MGKKKDTKKVAKQVRETQFELDYISRRLDRSAHKLADLKHQLEELKKKLRR